jgi:GDP-4-dehydro-6-deoxy-D-mannose reductase
MTSVEPLEVFNVCSGVPKHVKELASMMASAMGVDARFIVDQSRTRPGEAKVVCGSHAKLSARTGWQPQATSASALIRSFMADIFN